MERRNTHRAPQAINQQGKIRIRGVSGALGQLLNPRRDNDDIIEGEIIEDYKSLELRLTRTLSDGRQMWKTGDKFPKVTIMETRKQHFLVTLWLDGNTDLKQLRTNDKGEALRYADIWIQEIKTNGRKSK